MSIAVLINKSMAAVVANPSDFIGLKETMINDGIPAENIELSLDGLRDWTKQQVVQFTTATRAKAAGHVDPYQLAGWNDKAQRAGRLLANATTDADTAIIQAECDKRGQGETPQQLAQKQAAKAQVLATAVAIIDGMESQALAAVQGKRSENTLAALLVALETAATVALEQVLQQ